VKLEEQKRINHFPICQMTKDSQPPSPDIAAFRKMRPSDKWRMITGMHMQARVWKRAALRNLHPDWSEERVERTLREVFLHGTD